MEKVLVFILGCYLVFANNETTNSKVINLALETVVKFDKKDRKSDLQLIDSLQSFLDKIKEAIKTHKPGYRRKSEDDPKFSDYVKHTIVVLLYFDDDTLENAAKIASEEFRKYRYKGCLFFELMRNQKFRKLVNHYLEEILDYPAEELRVKLKNMYRALKLKSNYAFRNLIDFIDSRYEDTSLLLVHDFVKVMKIYQTKSKHDYTELHNLLRYAIRHLIFDQYSKLYINDRIELEEYLNEALAKRNTRRNLSKQRSSRRIVENKSKSNISEKLVHADDDLVEYMNWRKNTQLQKNRNGIIKGKNISKISHHSRGTNKKNIGNKYGKVITQNYDAVVNIGSFKENQDKNVKKSSRTKKQRTTQKISQRKNNQRDKRNRKDRKKNVFDFLSRNPIKNRRANDEDMLDSTFESETEEIGLTIENGGLNIADFPSKIKTSEDTDTKKIVTSHSGSLKEIKSKTVTLSPKNEEGNSGAKEKFNHMEISSVKREDTGINTTTEMLTSRPATTVSPEQSSQQSDTKVANFSLTTTSHTSSDTLKPVTSSFITAYTDKPSLETIKVTTFNFTTATTKLPSSEHSEAEEKNSTMTRENPSSGIHHDEEVTKTFSDNTINVDELPIKQYLIKTLDEDIKLNNSEVKQDRSSKIIKIEEDNKHNNTINEHKLAPQKGYKIAEDKESQGIEYHKIHLLEKRIESLQKAIENVQAERRHARATIQDSNVFVIENKTSRIRNEKNSRRPESAEYEDDKDDTKKNNDNDDSDIPVPTVSGKYDRESDEKKIIAKKHVHKERPKNDKNVKVKPEGNYKNKNPKLDGNESDDENTKFKTKSNEEEIADDKMSKETVDHKISSLKEQIASLQKVIKNKLNSTTKQHMKMKEMNSKGSSAEDEGHKENMKTEEDDVEINYKKVKTKLEGKSRHKITKTKQDDKEIDMDKIKSETDDIVIMKDSDCETIISNELPRGDKKVKTKIKGKKIRNKNTKTKSESNESDVDIIKITTDDNHSNYKKIKRKELATGDKRVETKRGKISFKMRKTKTDGYKSNDRDDAEMTSTRKVDTQQDYESGSDKEPQQVEDRKTNRLKGRMASLQKAIERRRKSGKHTRRSGTKSVEDEDGNKDNTNIKSDEVTNETVSNVYTTHSNTSNLTLYGNYNNDNKTITKDEDNTTTNQQPEGNKKEKTNDDKNTYTNSTLKKVSNESDDRDTKTEGNKNDNKKAITVKLVTQQDKETKNIVDRKVYPLEDRMASLQKAIEKRLNSVIKQQFNDSISKNIPSTTMKQVKSAADEAEDSNEQTMMKNLGAKNEENNKPVSKALQLAPNENNNEYKRSKSIKYEDKTTTIKMASGDKDTNTKPDGNEGDDLKRKAQMDKNDNDDAEVSVIVTDNAQQTNKSAANKEAKGTEDRKMNPLKERTESLEKPTETVKAKNSHENDSAIENEISLTVKKINKTRRSGVESAEDQDASEIIKKDEEERKNVLVSNAYSKYGNALTLATRRKINDEKITVTKKDEVNTKTNEILEVKTGYKNTNIKPDGNKSNDEKTKDKTYDNNNSDIENVTTIKIQTNYSIKEQSGTLEMASLVLRTQKSSHSHFQVKDVTKAFNESKIDKDVLPTKQDELNPLDDEVEFSNSEMNKENITKNLQNNTIAEDKDAAGTEDRTFLPLEERIASLQKALESVQAEKGHTSAMKRQPNNSESENETGMTINDKNFRRSYIKSGEDENKDINEKDDDNESIYPVSNTYRKYRPQGSYDYIKTTTPKNYEENKTTNRQSNHTKKVKNKLEENESGDEKTKNKTDDHDKDDTEISKEVEKQRDYKITNLEVPKGGADSKMHILKERLASIHKVVERRHNNLVNKMSSGSVNENKNSLSVNEMNNGRPGITNAEDLNENIAKKDEDNESNKQATIVHVKYGKTLLSYNEGNIKTKLKRESKYKKMKTTPHSNENDDKLMKAKADDSDSDGEKTTTKELFSGEQKLTTLKFKSKYKSTKIEVESNESDDEIMKTKTDDNHSYDKKTTPNKQLSNAEKVKAIIKSKFKSIKMKTELDSRKSDYGKAKTKTDYNSDAKEEMASYLDENKKDITNTKHISNEKGNGKIKSKFNNNNDFVEKISETETADSKNTETNLDEHKEKNHEPRRDSNDRNDENETSEELSSNDKNVKNTFGGRSKQKKTKTELSSYERDHEKIKGGRKHHYRKIETHLDGNDKIKSKNEPDNPQKGSTKTKINFDSNENVNDKINSAETGISDAENVGSRLNDHSRKSAKRRRDGNDSEDENAKSNEHTSAGKKRKGKHKKMTTKPETDESNDEMTKSKIDDNDIYDPKIENNESEKEKIITEPDSTERGNKKKRTELDSDESIVGDTRRVNTDGNAADDENMDTNQDDDIKEKKEKTKRDGHDSNDENTPHKLDYSEEIKDYLLKDPSLYTRSAQRTQIETREADPFGDIFSDNFIKTTLPVLTKGDLFEELDSTTKSLLEVDPLDNLYDMQGIPV